MKLGFIGCGNMAGAMMDGIVKSGIVSGSDIMAADLDESKLNEKKNKLGIQTTTVNTEVAEAADILFLAVKPQFYDTVTGEIKDYIKSDMTVVTIAPGKTLKYMADRIGADKKVIRTMPNTPAMVGEGMMGMCPNENVTEEDLATVRKICDSFGKTEAITENLMDVVTAVSGSSPAYVFMFIEAMADAAVAGGMARDKAYKFAAQAVLGSAKMVLETGKHPGELKDIVCSPAGTTIQAVRVLEEKGMRSAVFEAMMKCLDISRSL